VRSCLADETVHMFMTFIKQLLVPGLAPVPASPVAAAPLQAALYINLLQTIFPIPANPAHSL